jgi:hypothetical protein
MSTSIANEPFCSFFASWINNDWDRWAVALRCASVPAIAAVLRIFAADFGIEHKVGVVRTGGGSNCVAAVSLLARDARRTVSMKQRRIEVYFPRPENGIKVEIDSAFQHHVASCAFAGAHSEAADTGSPDDEEDDDDELDGSDAALPGVGSDGDQGTGEFPGMIGVGDAGASAAAGDAEPADQFFAFYDAIQGQLELAFATTASESSSFLWLHARCATHTLQLCIRAGLSLAEPKRILDKVRQVAKLSTSGRNFSQVLKTAVAAGEEAAAAIAGRPAQIRACKLAVDCPTIWGSSLRMIFRFLELSSAVPTAVMRYYIYAETTKQRVESLGPSGLRDLHSMVKFLKNLEMCSTELGTAHSVTAPLEEMCFWMMRRSGQEDIGDTDAVTALKKCVLRERMKRRSAANTVGTNRGCLGRKLAAVLFDRFLKPFVLDGDESSAAEADSCAVAVTIWMTVRAG